MQESANEFKKLLKNADKGLIDGYTTPDSPRASKAEEDKNTTKTAVKQTAKLAAKKTNNADFKRKYFDYYDDIKISDRQDW